MLPVTATPPERVFVFPSGGSGGATQVGILRALLETGIYPDAVVGSSVGALNAAFLAIDPTAARADELAAIWAGITRGDVFGRNRYGTVYRLARRHDHIYTPLALRALITRFCAVSDLADTKIPVHVVTTDLDHGVARWWASGPAHEILYASACLPGLFPPAVLSGHRHVDGGVLEPAPVGYAVDLDPAEVYVLGEVVGPDADAARRLTALDVLIRSFAISRYARLPEPSMMARLGQRVITVPGASTAGIEITNFSHTSRLIRDSYERAAGFLALSRSLDQVWNESSKVASPAGGSR